MSLVFWAVPDERQITLKLENTLAHCLPFGGVISHSEILLMAVRWGGIPDITLDNLSSVFSGESFCPQGFLLLSSWYGFSSVYEGWHQEGNYWWFTTKLLLQLWYLLWFVSPIWASATELHFLSEYLWIYNCSENIWQINNSELSIFPALFLHIYHLLMFSWSGNNILYGTSGIKIWYKNSGIKIWLVVDYWFFVWYLENKPFLTRSPSALLSHLPSVQRSLVLHFESLKMSIFNYWLQNHISVIELIILSSLSLPHSFFFSFQLYIHLQS